MKNKKPRDGFLIPVLLFILGLAVLLPGYLQYADYMSIRSFSKKTYIEYMLNNYRMGPIALFVSFVLILVSIIMIYWRAHRPAASAASGVDAKNLQEGVSGVPSKADELLKLKKLADDGVITQEEFEKEKEDLLK